MSQFRSIPVSLHGTMFILEELIEDTIGSVDEYGEKIATEDEAVQSIVRAEIGRAIPSDDPFKLRDWEIDIPKSK